MGKTKPPYPAAFKQQIVELLQAGRSQSELAREFDVSAGSIANWVTRASASGELVRIRENTGEHGFSLIIQWVT